MSDMFSALFGDAITDMLVVALPALIAIMGKVSKTQIKIVMIVAATVVIKRVMIVMLIGLTFLPDWVWNEMARMTATINAVESTLAVTAVLFTLNEIRQNRGGKRE